MQYSNCQSKRALFLLASALTALSYSFCCSVVAATDDPKSSPAPVTAHEMMNATLWQQSSGEYFGLTTQIYRLAKRQLDNALQDTSWTASLEQTENYQSLPPAIVLDIDETILKNTCYEARIITDLGQYPPEFFASWVGEAKAPAIPGVVDFLIYAVSRGVAVYLFSGRAKALTKPTVENLKLRGVPIDADGENLLLSDGSSTSERRARVAKHYRILLQLGDNLDDFFDGSRTDHATRLRMAQKYRDFFGSRWIILPNAIYGHWEASLYNYGYASPREAVLETKNGLLDTCTEEASSSPRSAE